MFIANTTSPGSTLSAPTLPVFELSNTKTSAGAVSHTEEDSLRLTIVFGVLGLLVAIVGISIAVLKLRHMLRRTKTVEIFELACKSKMCPVVEQYTDLFVEWLGLSTKRLEKRPDKAGRTKCLDDGSTNDLRRAWLWVGEKSDCLKRSSDRHRGEVYTGT